MFKKDESDQYYDAGVAIDDIELLGCDMSRPQVCMPYNKYYPSFLEK